MRNVLFLFLLLPALVFSQENIVEKEDTSRIYWSDWYRIEWSDFQAEPKETEKVAALSSIGLPYGFSSDGEGVMTVQINVCFLKEESWSKKNKQNNVLLQHEQLHFDIAEMHRRMIVKELMEADFNKSNYKELLETIIDRIWISEYRKTQDLYDKETNFSRTFKEQINWNKYITQQLRNLEDYAFTELEISLISFD